MAVTVESCQRFSQRMEKNIDVKKVVLQMTTGEAVKEIACELRDKLNCEASAIFIVEDDKQLMTLYAGETRGRVHYSTAKGIAGRAATTGNIINVR